MDTRVIAEKLEALRQSVKRVEEKCPDSLEVLVKDRDVQDIVTFNLTRAIQLCVDIGTHIISQSEASPPETMGAAFDTLVDLGVIGKDVAARMKRAVGFRNVAVHNYQDIDWDIVHRVCRQSLNDFAAFARAVTQAVKLEL